MEYYDPMEMKCPWCRRPMQRELFGSPPEDEVEDYDNGWMRPAFGKEYEGILPMDLLQMPPEDIRFDEEDTMPKDQMAEDEMTAQMDDYEAERDFARMKDLYPETAKELMPLVEEECDKLEYEGSLMFDEYPDRTMISEITGKIYDQVKGKYDIQEGEDKDEMLAMNVETYRRYPPKKNWLRDLAEVLFLDEIFRRRHRRRRHRR